jgi:transposase
MALVVLSKVEQRLDAVRAVLAGASVVEVAAAFGVSRVSVHAWLRRYLVEGLSGLADRSHKPRSCPHQASDSVAVLVAEMRRQHPRWGAKRIRMELLRKPPEGVVISSTATVNRILVRHGLVLPAETETAAGVLCPLAAASGDAAVADRHCRRGDVGRPGDGGAAGGEGDHRCRRPQPVLCDRLGGGTGHRARRLFGIGRRLVPVRGARGNPH